MFLFTIKFSVSLGTCSTKKPSKQIISVFLQHKTIQCVPILGGVYPSDNLPNKTKDGTYIINLDEYADSSRFIIYIPSFILFGRYL